MKLIKGKMSTRDLATWFGYSYGSFRNRKKELIPYLSAYCSYEECYGGINIKQVYFEEYMGDLSGDIKEYYEQVKTTPLNSISNITETAREKEQYANLSERQVRRRMTKAGIAGFGETAKKDSCGLYGSRMYKWVIKTYNPDAPYRHLTEEEKVIFDELTVSVFGENAEVVQRMTLLDEEFKKTDMTKEEYLQHKDRLTFCETFDQVIFRFKAETGEQLVKGTEHELFESAW